MKKLKINHEFRFFLFFLSRFFFSNYKQLPFIQGIDFSALLIEKDENEDKDEDENGDTGEKENNEKFHFIIGNGSKNFEFREISSKKKK